MIDLHTHSSASDGSLTPGQLVRHAAEQGVRAIALTDHDTVDGLDEALLAAGPAGIRVLPGIEIEVDFPPGEFHLLGLDLKDWGGSFRRRLELLKQFRYERNMKILKNMQDAGIKANYGELEDIAGNDVVGRPHFAQLLIRKGVVRTVQEAFRKYIGKGQEFYEPRQAMILEEAAGMIHDAGGKAIIAHPLSLYISLNKLPEILKTWTGYGIDGIEAYHSNASLKECKRLHAIADEVGIIATAGSDFHGMNRPDRRLGRSAGGMEIADIFLAPFEE